jgi:DNA-directed RNA polymerase specialized sigma24 family protein
VGTDIRCSPRSAPRHPVVPAPSAPPGREELVLSDFQKRLGAENPIDPATAELIGRKSRQILRQTGLPSSDREDVEQTLALLLLQRLPKFDPAEGDRAAFVRMVLRQATVNVLRFLAAAKRSGRPVSLDALLPTADDGATSEESGDLVLDLAGALEALPADLRAIANELRVSSKTEAARNLGIPRSTLHERAKEIRAAFERRALDDYL